MGPGPLSRHIPSLARPFCVCVCYGFVFVVFCVLKYMRFLCWGRIVELLNRAGLLHPILQTQPGGLFIPRCTMNQPVRVPLHRGPEPFCEGCRAKGAVASSYDSVKNRLITFADFIAGAITA